MYEIMITVLEKSRDEILKGIAKSSALSGAADGVVALVDKNPPKEVLKEVACGAFTGATSAGAKAAYEHFFKNAGTGGIVVYCAASVASRYAFRTLFPKMEVSPMNLNNEDDYEEEYDDDYDYDDEDDDEYDDDDAWDEGED